jgi:N-terminal domain of anti-restriction factor ArdC
LPPLLPRFLSLRHVGHAAPHERPNSQRRETMSSAATTAAIDSKKPTTKQELIASNIKLLIEQLEAGHSEALTDYLTAISRFHNYSFGNVLEIARQMPTATRVAGFWMWKNLGRSVNAGAKGIRILAPMVGARRKKGEEAETDITQAEYARFAWLSQCLCLRYLADQWRRATGHTRSGRRPWGKHRTAHCVLEDGRRCRRLQREDCASPSA